MRRRVTSIRSRRVQTLPRMTVILPTTERVIRRLPHIRVHKAMRQRRQRVTRAYTSGRMPVTVLLPSLKIAGIRSHILQHHLSSSTILNRTSTISTNNRTLSLAGQTFVARFPRPNISNMSRHRNVPMRRDTAKGAPVTVRIVTKYRHGKRILPVRRINALNVTPMRQTPFQVRKMVLVRRIMFTAGMRSPIEIIRPTYQQNSVVAESVIISSTERTIARYALHGIGLVERKITRII